MNAQPAISGDAGPAATASEAPMYGNGVTGSILADRGEYAAWVCYYCGSPADTTDHVVPQSLLENWRLLGDTENYQLATGRNRVLTVPCCRQCNSILGAKYDATLADRKARLKARLRQKYQRVLAVPDWTPAQLDELGPRLRQHVELGIAHRNYIRKRLAW